MARRKAADLSVAQLEKLLAEKKGRLTTLSKRRTSLQVELSSVDKELQSLQGPGTAASKPRKKTRRRRPKNKNSLATVVNGILGDAPKGLGLEELVAKVVASGYKTKAKSFSNVVYQCVYNAKTIYRDKKNRTFRLKSSTKS